MKWKFYPPPPWYDPYQFQPQGPHHNREKDPMDMMFKFMRWQEAKERVKDKKKHEEEQKKKQHHQQQGMSRTEALGLTLALTPFIGTFYIYMMAWGLKSTVDLIHTIK